MTTEKEPILALTDTPGAEAEAVIRDGLGSYNVAQAGYRDQRPLAVLASDPENGEVIGGLIGRTSMGSSSSTAFSCRTACASGVSAAG